MKEALPSGWTETTIGQVAAVVTGKTPPTANTSLFAGDLPFARPGDLCGTPDLLVTESTIADTALTHIPRLPAGTVLVSCIGNLGKTAILRREGSCNQQINAILPTASASPEFLFAWVKTLQSWLDANSSATTVAIINKGRFLNAPLRLPPLNEQRRIVAKLDSLQERSRRARDSLDAVPALLDKLRQSILAAAFRGDLTRDFREQHKDLEPASKLLQRIRTERRKKWEEAELAKLTAKGKSPTDDKWKSKYKEPDPVDTTGLPKLPDGWCWASVEELSTKVVDGVHKKPNYVTNGIPFLTVKNLTAGPGISFDEVNYITVEDHEEYIKRTDPELGDLLISKDGTLGVTRLVRTETTFSIFVSLALVKPVLRTMGVYLEAAFQSPFFQERFKATGSGLLHIHLVDLRAAALPIAPLAEQELVAERAREALARLEATALYNQEILASLGSLDRAILAKAFRGELVPQDPSDEPADVMLARTTASPAPAREKRGRRPGAKDVHSE